MSGSHLLVWVEGNLYHGRRPHVRVPLAVAAPEVIVAELRSRLSPAAGAVEAAVVSYESMTDEDYYADSVRLLEPAYLRAVTVEGGSGVGGTAEDWRRDRIGIVDGIDRDGTFLDVGCANGLLMESVQQ